MKEYLGDDDLVSWCRFQLCSLQCHALVERGILSPPGRQAAAVLVLTARTLQGRRKAFYFLPGHVGWFNRYRPLPQKLFESQSKVHPLIATRMDLVDQVRPHCRSRLP